MYAKTGLCPDPPTLSVLHSIDKYYVDARYPDNGAFIATDVEMKTVKEL